MSALLSYRLSIKMNASPDVHGHEIGAENSHHIGDSPTPR